MVVPGKDTGYDDIAKHKVVEEKYWSLNLTEMSGDKDIKTDNYTAIIDSGTSLIAGPKEIIEPLIKYIKVDKNCEIYNENPDITITIDSTDYTLP